MRLREGCDLEGVGTATAFLGAGLLRAGFFGEAAFFVSALLFAFALAFKLVRFGGGVPKAEEESSSSSRALFGLRFSVHSAFVLEIGVCESC